MTAEQEKYIIEKYPNFWDGVYCPDGCLEFRNHRFPEEYRGFIQYINLYNRVYRRLAYKSGVIDEYLSRKILSPNEFRRQMNLQHINVASSGVKCGAFSLPLAYCYLNERIQTFSELIKAVVFISVIINTQGLEDSSINTFITERIDDAYLVYEIIHPNRIYSAIYDYRSTDVLEKRFRDIDKILSRHDRYVYFQNHTNANDFINPRKRELYNLFVRLLKERQCVKENKQHKLRICTSVIDEETFLINCINFLDEIQVYNSRVFYSRMISLLGGGGLGEIKDVDCPLILCDIFEQVREFNKQICEEVEE